MHKIHCAVARCTGEVKGDRRYCDYHHQFHEMQGIIGVTKQPEIIAYPVELPPADATKTLSIADKYPKYYKKTGGMTEVDVYHVHQMFDIQDPSGAIHHSSKKLLLSGVRTGGKSKYEDIKEARDTLTRWLELNTP